MFVIVESLTLKPESHSETLVSPHVSRPPSMSAPADHTQIEVKVGMQFCELEASTGITWEGAERAARNLN